MKASEVVKSIELADEFTVCKETLLKVETAEMEGTEEYNMVASALFRNFWGIPKMQKQDEWIAQVLEIIEKREDSKAFLLHFLEYIKKSWIKIDIRLKSKFSRLVKGIAQKLVQGSGVEIESYITKGPEASYDLELMHAYIQSRSDLTDKEHEYLLEYLLKHADTYFTNFFINNVLPKLQETGISKVLAEKAYAEGNREEVSSKMRELLYSIHQCSAE